MIVGKECSKRLAPSVRGWSVYLEDSAGFSEDDSVAGGVDAGAGADSPDVAGRSITEDSKLSCLEMMAKLKDVSMKMMAAPTVTLLRNVPGPRLPKTV